MRIAKALIVVLCAILITASAGCRRPTDVVITDPAELEKLWQEYFCDAVSTVGNTFSSAAEIDPVRGIAEYCYFKYIGEHGKDSLQPESPVSFARVLPLETVLSYAERYFNLTAIDLANADPAIYDPQKRAFLFGMGLDQPRPAYNSGKPFGYQLTTVTRHNDGTLTAVLTKIDSISGRSESTMTYTMKQRDDGSLYFVAGKREYINNHVVSLTGEYQRFDGIRGFDGRLEELAMVGEADGKLVLTYAPGDNPDNGALLLVNPKTMAVEKRLPVSGLSPGNATLTDRGILVRLADRYVIVDKDLTGFTEKTLPESILAASKGAWFGGYDVVPESQTFVYIDSSGVKMIEPGSQEQLLFKTRGEHGTMHGTPRFVAGGRKVIATLCTYDGPGGYTIHDLSTGTTATHRIGTGGTSTGDIRSDTGLVEVNSFLTNDGGLTRLYSTVYLDFASGEIRQVPLDDKGDTDYIVNADQAYVGQNCAAFITMKFDSRDNANSLYFIHRYDLRTMKVEPAIITVKAANTSIIGVLGDGRIVFRYNWNPSETGICITK